MTVKTKKTVRIANDGDIGDCVFMTDADTVPTVSEVEEEIRQKEQKLVAIIPDHVKHEEGKFINETLTAWHYAWVLGSRPLTYLEGQEESGLKPGDWVRITRKAEDKEGGWKNDWNSDMDQYVGSVVQIKSDSPKEWGVSVSGCQSYLFPWFVLEKVTTRPANMEDIGRKCYSQDLGDGAALDATYKTASDGTLWAVIRAANGVRFVRELDRVQVFLDQSGPEPRPDWLPIGWRVMGPDEVIKITDKVQANGYPDKPRSCDIDNTYHWSGAEVSLVLSQVGRPVKNCRWPNDIWITKEA